MYKSKYKAKRDQIRDAKKPYEQEFSEGLDKPIEIAAEPEDNTHGLRVWFSSPGTTHTGTAGAMYTGAALSESYLGATCSALSKKAIKSG